jgi:hypothetical protein
MNCLISFCVSGSAFPSQLIARSGGSSDMEIRQRRGSIQRLPPEEKLEPLIVHADCRGAHVPGHLIQTLWSVIARRRGHMS